MNNKAAIINQIDLRFSMLFLQLLLLVVVLKVGVCSGLSNGVSYTTSGVRCVKFKYAGRWYPESRCAATSSKPWCATSTKRYKYNQWDNCTKNPCKYHKCSSNKKCKNFGTTAECITVCPSETCGENTNCVAQNHKPICSCKPGFSGNPNMGCRDICPVNDYISQNMSSLQPFTRNTVVSISLLPGPGKHYVSFEVGEMKVFRFLTSLKLQVILRQEELTETWILEGKVIDQKNRPMFNNFEQITLPVSPPYGQWISLGFLITYKQVTISLTWDACSQTQSFFLTLPGSIQKKSLFISAGNVKVPKPFKIAWDCKRKNPKKYNRRNPKKYNPNNTADDSLKSNYNETFEKDFKKRKALVKRFMLMLYHL